MDSSQSADFDPSYYIDFQDNVTEVVVHTVQEVLVEVQEVLEEVQEALVAASKAQVEVQVVRGVVRMDHVDGNIMDLNTL